MLVWHLTPIFSTQGSLWTNHKKNFWLWSWVKSIYTPTKPCSIAADMQTIQAEWAVLGPAVYGYRVSPGTQILVPVLVLVRCSHYPLGQDPCRDITNPLRGYIGCKMKETLNIMKFSGFNLSMRGEISVVPWIRVSVVPQSTQGRPGFGLFWSVQGLIWVIWGLYPGAQWGSMPDLSNFGHISGL